MPALRFLIILISCSSLSLIINTAHAESRALNAEIIEQWMQSQKALSEWGKQHESALEKAEGQAENFDNPMDMTADSLIQPIKSAGLYSSANELVTRYGFRNMEDWAGITLRITIASAAIEFEKHPEMMDNSALEDLKNMPQISDQQKAVLMQAIEQNKAIVERITSGTSQKDMHVVRPFLTRIHQLMEE